MSRLVILLVLCACLRVGAQERINVTWPWQANATYYEVLESQDLSVPVSLWNVAAIEPNVTPTISTLLIPGTDLYSAIMTGSTNLFVTVAATNAFDFFTVATFLNPIADYDTAAIVIIHRHPYYDTNGFLNLSSSTSWYSPTNGVAITNWCAPISGSVSPNGFSAGKLNL